MFTTGESAYNWKWFQALSSISRQETLEDSSLIRDRQFGMRSALPESGLTKGHQALLRSANQVGNEVCSPDAWSRWFRTRNRHGRTPNGSPAQELTLDRIANGAVRSLRVRFPGLSPAD